MSGRGWVQFAAVSLLWGVVYLLIKVAGEELSAAALTFARAFAGEDALGVTAWVFVISAAVLALPALASAPTQVPGVGTLAATAALGIACTAVVFVLWYRLIAEIGAARATVVTYVNPAV